MLVMKNKRSSLVIKFVFFTVPIIVIAMTAISLTGYRYAKKEIVKNLRSEMSLQAQKTSSTMNGFLLKERAVAQGLAKATENILTETYIAKDYEKLLVLFLGIYPEVAGMGIWFKENAFPGIKKAAPYVYRDGNRIVTSDEYTKNDFNIWTSEWYQVGTASKDGGWTEAYKDEVTGVSMTTVAYPIYDRTLHHLLGCVTVDVDISNLKKAVNDMKISHGGNKFLISNSGVFLAGVSDDKLMKQRAQDDPNIMFAEAINSMLNSTQTGLFEFEKNGSDFCAFYAPLEETSWYIILEFEKERVLASLNNLQYFFLGIGFLSVIVMTMAIYFFTRIVIVRPINGVIARLKDIAQGEGDLTMRLKTKSKDELGELALWFNVFMEKIQSIITKISDNTNRVDGASGDLSDIAAELSFQADKTSDRANNVAKATAELKDSITTVAVAMEQSTANTSMVASASEEMSATISQIVESVEEASQISDAAVNQAEETAKRMEELEQAALTISNVIETITDISEKTNLLALNATIEAVKAGEAGKGFSVVATEIKELSSQTSEATNDIKNQVSEIQQSSNHTISSIDEIVKIINQINKIIHTITIAVEEQAKATQEITANIVQANEGLIEINRNVNQGASISSEISNNISQVSEAAKQATGKSSELKGQSAQLQELSSALKEIVNSFKISG
ncbi:MAG: chemotaxis protein [Acidobacteria bacterium]|nr:MAG: chemotaxis protein [Acidobacteriota bacterium]